MRHFFIESPHLLGIFCELFKESMFECTKNTFSKDENMGLDL